MLLRATLIVGWMLAAAAVAGAASPGRSRELAAAYGIPRLEGIGVDGESGDWGERGFRVEVMTDELGELRHPADFDPTLRLAWDDRGLLVMAEVWDDSLVEVENQRRMFEGDAVELFIGSRRGRHDYYMLLIGPGVDPTQPGIRRTFFDERGGGPDAAEGLPALEATIARRRTADGYRVEVLLPWGNLPEVESRVGAEISFQAYAMDRDSGDTEPYRACWYPAYDTHLNSTNSMYRLRLAEAPSPPVRATVRGQYRDVVVVAGPDWAGRAVRVTRGDEPLADGLLTTADGRAAASLRLPRPDRGQPLGRLSVELDGAPPVEIERGGAAAMVGKAVEEGGLGFFQHVFSGEMFPVVEFEDPELVRNWIGDFGLRPRFFNSRFEEVTRADEPGWYGAVVEIDSEEGRTTRRFFTLFRTPDDQAVPRQVVPAWALPSIGTIALPGGVTLSANEATDAGLTEAAAIRRSAQLGAQVDTSAPEADVMDKRWWVRLKRTLYEVQGRPVLPEPEPSADAIAPILREGSPEEAGMDPAVSSELDALCRQWLSSAKNDGFSVCVSRRGVVFFHKAYGNAPDGQPMTTATPARMSSATKLLAGVLLMMYVDRGLVDLDVPLDRYLPALRGIDVATPFTFRQLHTHTSGLAGHYGDDLRDLDERIADEYAFLEVPVTHLYNSVGMALSTKGLELVSGEPYPVLFRRLLVDPLGMEHTIVKDSWGNAYSTALDYAKVGQMLLNGGSYGHYRFMSPETVELAKPKRLTEVFGEEATKTWGIGFWGDTDNERSLGGTAFGHTSANSAMLRIDPAADLVIAVSSVEKGNGFSAVRKRFIETIEEHIRDASAPHPNQGDAP